MSVGSTQSSPHMLIAGGTGGRKDLLHPDPHWSPACTLQRRPVRVRPKNADLADLQAVMPDVYYKGRYARLHWPFLWRNDETQRKHEAHGELPDRGKSISLSLMNMWHLWKCSATKENAAVLNKLKQIVMLGRQAGFFLILACQRPDAKYLGTESVTSLISVWLWGGCRKWAMGWCSGKSQGLSS